MQKRVYAMLNYVSAQKREEFKPYYTFHAKRVKVESKLRSPPRMGDSDEMVYENQPRCAHHKKSESYCHTSNPGMTGHGP